MDERRVPRWPLLLIGAPAAVAIWSGWVALGALCGFGPVHVLPGIMPHLVVNTAITLPVGVEAYATYALGAWLRPSTPAAARRFARWSAIGSLLLGGTGQVAYHLLAAQHAARAPVPVIVVVSCVPVVALGFGAALAHLLRAGGTGVAEAAEPRRQTAAERTLAPLTAALAARIAPQSLAAPAEDAVPQPEPHAAEPARPVRRKARQGSRSKARRKTAAERDADRERWAEYESDNEGASAAEVAAAIGVNKRTVERWRGAATIAEAERALVAQPE